MRQLCYGMGVGRIDASPVTSTFLWRKFVFKGLNDDVYVLFLLFFMLQTNNQRRHFPCFLNENVSGFLRILQKM
jgi:hypothetical protein